MAAADEREWFHADDRASGRGLEATTTRRRACGWSLFRRPRVFRVTYDDAVRGAGILVIATGRQVDEATG